MATYVVCIDGTWNGPGDSQPDPIDRHIETAGDRRSPRLHDFLRVSGTTRIGAPACARVACMSMGLSPLREKVVSGAGVGTFGNWVANQLSGAFGYGTMARILEAYRFLARQTATAIAFSVLVSAVARTP